MYRGLFTLAERKQRQMQQELLSLCGPAAWRGDGPKLLSPGTPLKETEKVVSPRSNAKQIKWFHQDQAWFEVFLAECLRGLVAKAP